MLFVLLKFLLFLLLAVLGLVLLLLLMVLFVPVRYEADLARQEGQEGRLDFSAHWLLRAVELRGAYDRQGLRYHLRALWFRLKETGEHEQG